jgi:AraC-like DNA-binding protein
MGRSPAGILYCRSLFVQTGAQPFVLYPDIRVTFHLGDAGRWRQTGTSHEFAEPLRGLHTRPVGGEFRGPGRFLSVSLVPWAAYSILGVPMHQLVDSVVELRDVARGLLAGLRGQRDLRKVAAFLGDRITHGHACAGEVIDAWNELSRVAGRISVGALAKQVGLGQRWLEARFREQIGLSPKVAAKLFRVRNARGLLAAGNPVARTAAECGYYDQAHLCREFKAVTGQTPTQFTSMTSDSYKTTPAGVAHPERGVREGGKQ